jgi:hypothetical protein
MIDKRWSQIEHAVAESLKQFYMLLITADLPAGNGHGPRLEGEGEAFTLPDLMVPGGRRPGWIEVKYKKDWWLYEKWGEEMHGIDAPKWLHYCKVRDHSRLPLYLLIMEESSGALLMQSLDTLRSVRERDIVRGTFAPGKPSINWKRASFVQMGTFFLDGDDPILSWDFPPLDTLLGQLSLVEA